MKVRFTVPNPMDLDLTVLFKKTRPGKGKQFHSKKHKNTMKVSKVNIVP